MSGKDFLDRLLEIVSGHKRIIVIGQVDTGKSTLVRNLADRMDAYVLDADIGQNDIGPPTVVSLGERADNRYRLIDGYFAGSTSPSGHFMQMMAGISRILPRNNKRPVLINTTGLATGEIGRTLKTEKINAIKPGLIIGLETENELQYLDAFAHAGAEVVRFKPHPRVTSRSRTERERLRTASFQAHFTGAFTSSHRLDKIGIERSLLGNGDPADVEMLSGRSGTPVAHAEVTDGEGLVIFSQMPGDLDRVASTLNVRTVFYCSLADYKGTLVGLSNSQGKFISLGIIDSLDFSDNSIRIYSPAERFSVVQAGSIKINACSFAPAGSFNMKVYRHKH